MLAHLESSKTKLEIVPAPSALVALLCPSQEGLYVNSVRSTHIHPRAAPSKEAAHASQAMLEKMEGNALRVKRASTSQAWVATSASTAQRTQPLVPGASRSGIASAKKVILDLMVVHVLLARQENSSRSLVVSLALFVRKEHSRTRQAAGSVQSALQDLLLLWVATRLKVAFAWREII